MGAIPVSIYPDEIIYRRYIVRRAIPGRWDAEPIAPGTTIYVRRSPNRAAARSYWCEDQYGKVVSIIGEDMLRNDLLEIKPATPTKGQTMTIAPEKEYSARNTPQLLQIDVGLIYVSGKNPRKRFDPDALQALADSIRMEGVIEPIIVREEESVGYIIIAGERRFRAAKLAGLTTIPAIVRDCSDIEAQALALIENLLRQELGPIEEADGYRRLMEMGLTQGEIADKVRRSQPEISNAMRLLKLPADVQEQISDGALSMSHGRALCSLNDHPEQARHYARIATESGWTSKKLEQEIAAFQQSQREADQPRILDTPPTQKPALQSFLTTDGEVRFADLPSETSEVEEGAYLAAVLDDGAPTPAEAITPSPESSNLQRPDTTNLLRSQEAPTTPIQVNDTRASVTSSTPVPPATKPASPPESDAATAPRSAMVACSIPAALDDWLWEQQLTAKSALELLRRIETVAARNGLQLEQYVTSLEETS